MLSEEKKQEIIKALESRKIQAKCPMCQQSKFSVVDMYVRNALQDDLQNLVLDGPAIPTAAIICMNCGFVSQHALGVLGLLPNPGAK